jgi:hypothetical protein
MDQMMRRWIEEDQTLVRPNQGGRAIEPDQGFPEA